METKEELIKWLKNMGYDGEIPQNLDNICNASTFFIWKQIIKNAKDRRVVQCMKRNIIIKRLQEKSLDEQDTFPYPIPEIEVYKKRQNLKKKIELLKSDVAENEHKLNSLSKNNKMKYVTIEHLRMKIQENEQREYLLNKKCEMLEENLKNTEESLSVAKSITPIEIEDCSNNNEITETLHKCADKLEKLLQQMPASQKFISNKSAFERCLSRNEKTIGGCSVIKENINAVKVNKRLFSKEKRALSPLNSEQLNTTVKSTSKSTKRESLGIVPEICIASIGDDDVFLSGPTHKPRLSRSMEIESVQQCSSTINENCNVTEMRQQSRFISKLRNNIDNSFENSGQYKNAAILENIANNKVVKEWLQDLLHSKNRKLIFNNLLSINENIVGDFKKLFVEIEPQNHVEISKFDIARLHFIHAQIETQNLKQKKVNKKLSDQIKKERERIMDFLHSRKLSASKIAELMGILDLEAQDLSLDAEKKSMKRHINSAQKSEYNNELQIIEKEIAGVKEKILCKWEGIQETVEFVHKMLANTQTTIEETSQSVRKLNQFVLDMSWAESLSMKLVSNEVKVFENFPLIFNRQFQHSKNVVYARDLCWNIIPIQEEIDSDTLYMISNILESPFSPPEAILLSILKSKLYLQQLKSTNIHINISDYVKYSHKELEKQESYVDHALNKMNHLIHSATSKKILSTDAKMKEFMDIWTEMPLKDFIAPHRLFNGQNYKHYEQMYDNYCNQ